MSRFNDVVRADTPRLVVMYRRDERGQEQFQWGMVGSMPLMTLIGYIVRVQGEMCLAEPSDGRECPQPALVVAWDAPSGGFEWFVSPDMPTDATVGMLETGKVTLLGTHLARQAANQQVILGPDGNPVRR